MFKKLIARILVVALLAQCLPTQALAEVGDSLLISQQELTRLAAEYTLEDGEDDYHEGMAYSVNFSLRQLNGYLLHLEECEIDPLSDTVEMLVNAVAKYRDSGPQKEVDAEKLRTLDGFMFNLHQLTDEITACHDGLTRAIGAISSYADSVWDKENYSLTKRAGFSRRIRDAVEDIESIRATVRDQHERWETALYNSEQAIRYDGTMNVAANDNASGLGAAQGYVTFTPRDTNARSARNGGWQLRDLYAELKPDAAPKLYTVSANDLLLDDRAPSLLERLSPVSTAYADRQEDATVTVIDDNQFAIDVKDASGAPVVGMVVRAVDADKMYTTTDVQFVESTTDQNGAAVFDIPGHFTLDDFDALNLYVECGPSEKLGFQEAHLWNVSVDRGSVYSVEAGETSDEPFLIAAAFDSADIIAEKQSYFHSGVSLAMHQFYVEMGNADPSGEVYLLYTSAEPLKDKNGKEVTDANNNYIYPTMETEHIPLTESDGKLTATIEDQFLRKLMPGELVTLVYADDTDFYMFPLEHLEIKQSVATAYKGGMKWLDFSTSSLLNFNIKPSGQDIMSANISLDNPFNIPEISVSFTLDGNLFILFGVASPDSFLHGRYKDWPGSLTDARPYSPTDGGSSDGEEMDDMEEVAGGAGAGPARRTSEDSEHASEEKNKRVNAHISRNYTTIKERFKAVEDPFNEERKKGLGTFATGAVDASIFTFFDGHLEPLGQKEGRTIGIFDSSLGLGLRVSYTGDWGYQWPLAFVGFTVTISANLVATTTLSEDVSWKSWTDWKVTTPNGLQAVKGVIITLYIKIQLEAYLGAGIKGLLEISLHGYVYFAFTFTWEISARGDDTITAKHKQPRIVISWGGGLYLLVKAIFLKFRFDLLPASQQDSILLDTWSTKSATRLSSTRSGGLAAPSASAANDGGGGEDDESKQTHESDAPVYNSDLLWNTETTKALVENVNVMNGKVRYARISGGKYRNKEDTDVHTYAFFLTPDSRNRPRLSYIDLDVPAPEVFNFDTAHTYDPYAWDYSSTLNHDLSYDAEFNDHRWYDLNEQGAQYDYDFAVANVADNNKLDKDNKAPLDGMSAVVCVLSASELEDKQVDIDGSGQTQTVRQPADDSQIYATVFVVNRIDKTTGRLSMVVSHRDSTDEAKNVGANLSKVFSKLPPQIPATAAETYVNPEITAAFANVTSDKSKSPNGLQFNANIYEAVVTFHPSNGKNKNDEDAGKILRYRTYACQYDDMFAAVDDMYSLDGDNDKVKALVVDRLQQLRQDYLWEPQEYWSKKDANNQDVYLANGQTQTLSVLPFEVDTTGLKDLWKNTDDFGPQLRWLETRGFVGSDKVQFYRFFERTDYTKQSSYEGWLQGAVDWVPLSPANLDSLVGRTGTGIVGHVAPWNPNPNDGIAFFLYGDDKGQSYLDSVRLSDGVLTDYGFAAPAPDMGCVDLGDSIVFYWFSAHDPVDLGNNQKGASFAFNTMFYEKASGVLFTPTVAAHVNAPNLGVISPFITETGKCYFATTDQTQADTSTGVHEDTSTTRFTFYKFDQKYTMGVEMLDAAFADGAVRQGAYDDINIRLRNNGNTPISGLTMEVYDVDEAGKESWMETIKADLDHPEKSSVEYSGLADGNKRTETGEQVVSLTEDSMFRTRGEWAVIEATPTGGSGSDALPTGWNTSSTYLTTQSLIPNDQASLQAPILIGADWKGIHTIRFKITEIVSSNDWAVDLEGNETRASKLSARNILRSEPSRPVAVTRQSDGSALLHYADEEPQSGASSLLTMLRGGNEPETPPNFSAEINFDNMTLDLDTSCEDLTLTAQPYTRRDGTEMVNLTAHNNAHADGEAKCVVLYAYADYDYENAWPVYDFGNLNAGSSATLSLPVDRILGGRTASTLLLDLHIDHEESRKSSNLESHNHKDGLLNGCEHDRVHMDDVVSLTIGHNKPLEITEQPRDFSTVTGGTATFSATVMGGVLPYAFQWQVRKPLYDKNGKHLLDEHGNWKYGDWEDWPDGNKITLDVVATAEMNGWQFHLIVRDTVGNMVASAFATLRLTDVPMTGDEAQPVLWAALALAALVTAILVLKTRKRRNTAK